MSELRRQYAFPKEYYLLGDNPNGSHAAITLKPPNETFELRQRLATKSMREIISKVTKFTSSQLQYQHIE